MSKNGFKVMDSDMHVQEPADLWQRYIDPAYANRAPIGLNRSVRDVGIQVEGKTLSRGSEARRGTKTGGFAKRSAEFNQEKYGDAIARNFDNVSQLNAMEQEGLDVAVLYPTRGLFVLGIDGLDPGLAAAIAKAYNDWMQEFCQLAPDRMYGAAMLAPHDVESAVAEARRTVQEFGFKAVFMRPTHVNGRKWSDPYYDPLWDECQRLGVPVGFHGAGFVYAPQPILLEFTPTFSMQNTLGIPMENMLACAGMIFGGVMERFPRLKVAFLEGSCSWVPWLLLRMGEYLELLGDVEYPDLKLTPLEYFQRQCYASVECDEITAKHLPEHGLENNVVFSTDYPHFDVKYPYSVETFLAQPFSEVTKRKFLWDNCATLYNF